MGNVSSHTDAAPDWDWAGDVRSTDATGDDPVVANEDFDIDALEIEIVNEEADRLNRRSAEARREAADLLSYAIPSIVERLNTMSATEQRAFLDQARKTVADYATPEMKRLITEDPSILQNGWELFMTQFREHGFEPLD